MADLRFQGDTERAISIVESADAPTFMNIVERGVRDLLLLSRRSERSSEQDFLNGIECLLGGL
jgi:hypothetical protein